MKKIIYITFTLCLLIINKSVAQKNTGGEKYGKTLNVGFGIGYYGYIGRSSPVIHADLEFDVAKNFTLAPFITYFSYTKYRYWEYSKNNYKNYSYRQQVIPIGLKGTYYFDQFLGAGNKWDFYLAGSLGLALRKTTWETSYTGDRTIENGSSNLYLDGHIGAEYHFNSKIGLVLDLSTGISTLCLAIHL